MESLKAQAEMLAEQLESCYEHPGFKIFWDRFEKELEQRKEWVAWVPSGPADGMIQELRFRQGYLASLIDIKAIKSSILKALKSGDIPWMKESLKKAYDEKSE